MTQEAPSAPRRRLEGARGQRPGGCLPSPGQRNAAIFQPARVTSGAAGPGRVWERDGAGLSHARRAHVLPATPAGLTEGLKRSALRPWAQATRLPCGFAVGAGNSRQCWSPPSRSHFTARAVGSSHCSAPTSTSEVRKPGKCLLHLAHGGGGGTQGRYGGCFAVSTCVINVTTSAPNDITLFKRQLAADYLRHSSTWLVAQQLHSSKKYISQR